MSTQSIIIDVGTCMTKAGLSDEPCPRSMFPTIVGRPKLPSIMVGMQNRDSYVGDEAQQKQNVLFLRNPIEHGFVKNWQDMQQILHHIYYSQLRVTPEQHACLIAESPKTQPKSRHKLAEIMFQSINVPQFYLSNQSVLSLFASGRTTGLVVDCGAGVTSSVPVFEGYAVPHAMRRNNFAGDDINTLVIAKLQKQQKIKLYHQTDRKTLLQVKSRVNICQSHQEYLENKKNSSNKNHQKNEQNGFTLPDGNWIDVASISPQCGQILFYPQQFGYQHVDSLQSLIKSTVDQCDKDIRHDIFTNIITSGGSSNIHNFASRLHDQLSNLYSSQTMEVIEKPHRQFLPWLGGSILSSLSTFQSMWVSKQEFMQNGASIIDKKCF